MEGVEPIPPIGVKIADSFSDLAKKIDWYTRDLYSKIDIPFQEFLQPLFDEGHLQLCDPSIILTIDGFIMGASLDDEKMPPEVKR